MENFCLKNFQTIWLNNREVKHLNSLVAKPLLMYFEWLITIYFFYYTMNEILHKIFECLMNASW